MTKAAYTQIWRVEAAFVNFWMNDHLAKAS